MTPNGFPFHMMYIYSFLHLLVTMGDTCRAHNHSYSSVSWRWAPVTPSPAYHFLPAASLSASSPSPQITTILSEIPRKIQQRRLQENGQLHCRLHPVKSLIFTLLVLRSILRHAILRHALNWITFHNYPSNLWARKGFTTLLSTVKMPAWTIHGVARLLENFWPELTEWYYYIHVCNNIICILLHNYICHTIIY